MGQIHPNIDQGEKRNEKPDNVRYPSLLWNWLFLSAGWEKVLTVLLIILVPFFLFHNLELNPRTWHDEGDALSVARTLAEDGYYGVKVSDGYQTFGIIQSIGPAVILPAAWAFKLFGINLVTGRLVAASFALLTLILFWGSGKLLIGQRAALIATIILISSPGVRYFYTGRQFMGIVPALGYFLAGFILWYHAIKSQKTWLAIASGLLIGCAILTKSQYLVLALGTFAFIAILDLLYYHLGAFKITAIIILVALACYGSWNLWQWFYYGPEIYAENGDKLFQLGKVAFGLRPIQIISGIRYILGVDTDHYFLFWGFLSLVYIGVNSLEKDIRRMGLMLLLIFTCLWLCFTIFWTIPWNWHFFAPLAISVLFISKMYDDLAVSVVRSRAKLVSEITHWIKDRATMSVEAMLGIGCLSALITITLWTAANFENVVSRDVLDRVGEMYYHWPRSFSLPFQTRDFLNQTVAPESIIETSERELAILTDFTYHSPEQSILIDIIPYVYHKTGVNDYQLGSEYFNSVKPAYLVIGYFARVHQVYAMDFISDNFEQIKVIGTGEFEYEIYRRITPYSD